MQRQWRCTNQRGDSLSQKRPPPLKPQEKGLTLQASSSKSCNACRLHFPARGVAAFGSAIRFGLLLLPAAALPVLRQCGLITVYRCTHQCGERSNAAFGRQSAAVLPSLAPHDSKARLQAVTTRRDSWRSHVHRTYITRKGYATSVRQQSCQRLCNAQRVQLFKLQTANVRGQGARPLAFSWGIKRGPFSHVREWPPLPVPLPAGKQHASPAGGNYCFFLIRINGVHWSS